MSERDRIVRRWLPVAAATLLVAVVAPRLRHGSGSGVATPSVPPPPAAVPAAAPVQHAWTVEARLPRDPFELAPAPARTVPGRTRPAPRHPETLEVAAPAPPQVQILLLDPKRPLALFDRQRVAVGDSIAGYRVVAIDAGGVTLERRGTRLVVRP